MKKKGFTLVELLAVIAILAILVIIALPNVLGMFNSAKKNTFVTEIQSIYSTAETQFVSDSMGDMTKYTGGIKYARVNGKTIAQNGTKDNYKKLDLSGTQTINYYIHFNLAGKVTEFYASDGQYQYIYAGPGLAKDKIVSTNIANDGVDQAGTPASEDILKVKPKFDDTNANDLDSGVITIADAISYKSNEWTRVIFDVSAGADKLNVIFDDESADSSQSVKTTTSTPTPDPENP